MTSTLAAALEFFSAEKWEVSHKPDSWLITTSYTGLNGQWLCFAQAGDDPARFAFYSVCPVIIPPARRVAVVEFLTRANYGGIIGNFEMNLDDGEVRYKTSLGADGCIFTPNLIRPLVHTNIVVMDNYLPGLLTVAFGNTSPKITVQQAELIAPPPTVV